MTNALTEIVPLLAAETKINVDRVRTTLELLQQGSSVPFVARYRKELTGELDEVQIRLLEERFNYFSELLERRQTILKTIADQGKLTPELNSRILACHQKAELEDLYLPYRPKRRTKAAMAREQGLGPLADQILAAAAKGKPLIRLAQLFTSTGETGTDPAAALQGAGYIIAESYADNAAARALVRRLTWEQGLFVSRPMRGKEATVSKYEMYYDYREKISEIPSHRMLAMRRGEKEEILRLELESPEDDILSGLNRLLIRPDHCYRDWLLEVLADSYRRLLAPAMETELRLLAKQAADSRAISVFSVNLRHLLLEAPAGSRRVLGIDPGLRTGSKLAVIDQTGRFLDHATIYPHTGRNRREPAEMELLRLIEQHQVEMVAIGNGTAGREMDHFVRGCLKEKGMKLPVVMVSEAGASVYSASDLAREEFPELDLTIRGAISIARRLQDPLAELVKVEPKSIGVGQYQHDVDQGELKKALDGVVESCVNYVGVDLNTASWALLSFVSGISPALAKAIVRYRDDHGAFRRREDLLRVPRFGPKVFEQAAGFLRIRDGSDPLDNTAVHPERYALVARLAADAQVELRHLLAEPELLDTIDLNLYLSDEVGLPTLRDIIAELKKPGRDPRETFAMVDFNQNIVTIADLRSGMVVNGIVTNVAAFGAFVDIGVHQDGLVHISKLADRFVKDPNAVVRVGQPVRVRVLDVDQERRRISLSMRCIDLEEQGRGGEKAGQGIKF